MTAPPSHPPLSLDEIARLLDLHPFDVARVLGQQGEMPVGLRFQREDLERISGLAGIETWWPDSLHLPAEDPARSEALAVGLCRLLFEHDLVGGRWTRADNLLRGLDGDDQRRLRGLINALIRARVLQSSPSWRGLQLSVVAGRVSVIQDLARGVPLGVAVGALEQPPGGFGEGRR